MTVKIGNLDVVEIPWGVNREVEKIMFGGEEVFTAPPPPISTPGIYHNPKLGLISFSSDGTNWATIQDKNLGAIEYLGQSSTESNSYGDYYCWGAREPGSGHANEEDWEVVQTIAPNGYHIPTINEWKSVVNLFTSITGYTTRNSEEFKSLFKLPFAGAYWSGNANASEQGTDGYYWSSSSHPAFSNYAYDVYLQSPIHTDVSDDYISRLSIRLFKDTPVQPTTEWATLYPNSN